MSVLLGIILVVLTFTSVVLVTKLSFRNAREAYLTLNSIHKRQSEQLDKTIDRLMTIDWERFAAVHASEEDQVGGFIPPEGEDEPVSEEDTRWAQLRRLRFSENAPSNEELALLDEDFPDLEAS